MKVLMMEKIPGKILGKYPAVKLPNEIHAFILTNQCIVSVFIKKLERKISLKKTCFCISWWRLCYKHSSCARWNGTKNRENRLKKH